MTRTIVAKSVRSDARVEAIIGTKLDDNNGYRTLIQGEDVNVLKPDGSPLLIYRHRTLPEEACRAAYPLLLQAGTGFTNHRQAESGTIGFYDRPQPRVSAFTQNFPTEWEALQPFLQVLNLRFRRLLPEQHAFQMRAIKQTDPRWVIRRTAFTTVTVNRTEQFAVHRDSGNLLGSMAVMTAIDAGRYDGCYLAFPQYQVAVDLRATDLLLADVNQAHGNTRYVGLAGSYERVSVVAYYRAGLRGTGTG